ncbi:MAG: prolyl oligopeptidase family serine peptidase [Candidatus Eiseniibacteriota bacterium]
MKSSHATIALSGWLLAAGLAATSARADAPAASATVAAPAASATITPSAPAASATVATSAPPPAARRPVEDTFWDTAVREDYRWLENWSDPEVKSWVDGQNTYTRDVLDKLPQRPEIFERIQSLNRSITPHYRDLVYRGTALFAMKDQPPKNQPLIVRLESPDDTTRQNVIVDCNLVDPSGNTTINFYEPSLDGSKIAVSLSQGGTESGDLHIYDALTGKPLEDVIPRVNGGTAGGSVAWNADGTGFWYTRYPRKGERPDEDLDFYQQVFFHKLGSPESEDKYVIGKGFPKIAEIALQSSDDGKRVLIDVRNGDGGEHGFWLKQPSGSIVAVAGFKDRAVQAEFGGTGLFLMSLKESPNGSVLRVPFERPAIVSAKTIVPASDIAIESIHVSGTRLYVQDIVGGPSQIRMFSFTGAPLGKLPLPPVVSVGGFARFKASQVLIERQSYTEPPKWMRYDPAAGGLTPTALEMKSPADYSDIEVRREIAVSKDGTKVPMNILMKKGTVLDGHAPALIYGYGGYGLSERPYFSSSRRLWLEQGGVYAVANIRGGGEFGDAWHLAGNLTHKQNVFDDFAACAQHLVDRKYTTPERMACQGGSNGGLLMGATLVQHPELFGAVISSVGIYDMLRVELSPNGLFNTTEFGTVKDSAQFRALMDYSPYHNVKDGTQYPALLLLTGVNDPRVTPGNSFKFAARLQASGTTKPVLLRTSMTTGHIGTPLAARNQELADIYSFLFAQLGVKYQPLSVPAP